MAASIDSDGRHLALEPDIMLGCFLLLPHEVAHEITQELGAGTVTEFHGRSEFLVSGPHRLGK